MNPPLLETAPLPSADVHYLRLEDALMSDRHDWSHRSVFRTDMRRFQEVHRRDRQSALDQWSQFIDGRLLWVIP